MNTDPRTVADDIEAIEGVLGVTLELVRDASDWEFEKGAFAGLLEETRRMRPSPAQLADWLHLSVDTARSWMVIWQTMNPMMRARLRKEYAEWPL